MGDRWSKKEINILKKYYLNEDKYLIEKNLSKRKWKSIVLKAFELNLSRNRMTDKEFKIRISKTGLKPLEKYNHKSHQKMKFLCYCGKTFYAKPNKIFDGHTKSCGCLLIKNGELKSKRYKEISYSYFKRIIRGAKLRRYKFNLTIKYLWNLFLKQNKRCAYSNQELTFSRNICLKPQDQTASLDRKNNLKGYVVGNVQWIHKDINFMKQDMGDKEFIKMCKKISDFRG